MNSPALRLTASNGSEATIMLHGAHLVSWKPRGDGERIYLSEKAAVSPGKAIRGGIPICFPQFSDLGPGPSHGFARILPWCPVETSSGSDNACAVFRLSESPETRAFWPYRFQALLRVSLSGSALETELEVANTGTETLSFTTALHTYLRIVDIGETAIEGLAGTVFNDKVSGLDNRKETRDRVIFTEQTDRIYFNTPPELVLHERGQNLRISSRNMPDTVIWNPWIERSLSIPDLPDDAYRFMVCIEAGHIGTEVRLNPGDAWKGGQTLTA